jgi:hypothetical protein
MENGMKKLEVVLTSNEKSLAGASQGYSRMRFSIVEVKRESLDHHSGLQRV